MSEGGSVFRVIREENEAFGETYTGPKHEKTFIRFDESANNKIFETANGMTRKEVQEKNEADVEALFGESEKENIGGVFEKEDRELPKVKEEGISFDNNKTSTIGIDLDLIKKIEKESVKKEKEMNHDDMGMSGPSRVSSMNFL